MSVERRWVICKVIVLEANIQRRSRSCNMQMEHVHHEQRLRVRKWPGTASVYLTRVCTP
jgi:hypothetical protein